MDPNENSLPPAATLGYELVKERLSLDDAQDNSEKGVGIWPGKPKSNCNLSEL